MPRNSSGVYVQPASDVNPPVFGTPIDPAAWAAAITDLGTELTNSLDRLGRAPMQAPLAMSGQRITGVGAPVNPTDAARLSDFGSYLPPGAIGHFSQKTAPLGWLVADGSAISRSTYAALFAVYNADGLIYGVGDGSTTFNLPNFQGASFKSWDNGRGLDPARVFGSLQADALPVHNHVQPPHTHSPADPGHFHGYQSTGGGGQSTTTVTTGMTISSTIATNTAISAGVSTNNYAILVCIRF